MIRGIVIFFITVMIIIFADPSFNYAFEYCGISLDRRLIWVFKVRDLSRLLAYAIAFLFRDWLMKKWLGKPADPNASPDAPLPSYRNSVPKAQSPWLKIW